MVGGGKWFSMLLLSVVRGDSEGGDIVRWKNILYIAALLEAYKSFKTLRIIKLDHFPTDMRSNFQNYQAGTRSFSNSLGRVKYLHTVYVSIKLAKSC